MRVTMLLADFAQVSDGKLTVVGGGWSLTGPEAVPFGIAILILLWQTIGTLLDQSLFFLVAGAALLATAWGARRLFARLNSPAGEAA